MDNVRLDEISLKPLRLPGDIVEIFGDLEIFKDCQCNATLFYEKYKRHIYEFLIEYQQCKKECEGYNETQKFKEKLQIRLIELIRQSAQTETQLGILNLDEENEGKRDAQVGTKDSETDKTVAKKGKIISDVKGVQKKGAYPKSYVTSGTTDTDASTSGQTSSQRSMEMAFNMKLDKIFDESYGEAQFPSTERGYYMFEPSEQETMKRLTSLITFSSVEEEVFSMPTPKPKIGEWMSETEKKAREYIKSHKVNEFFKFLGAHLVSANPCNPIDYLIALLDKCISYRQGYEEPPLLFLPRHIESLFNSMDPMGTGFIDLNQYHNGMFTLGIKEYNMFPEIVNDNQVEKIVFTSEAYLKLRQQLNEMIYATETPSVSTMRGIYSIRGEAED